MADLTITVKEVNKNEYGDLLVKDENGNEHRVKAKRSHLFLFFAVGNKVKLVHSTYQGHEYISDAIMEDGTAKSPEQVNATPTKEDPTAQNIAVQVAIKEIGECWRTGKLVKGDPFDEILVENYKAWVGKQVGVEKK